MKTSFIPVQFPQDKERLINFLTNETWPFHVNNKLTSDKVIKMIEDGVFVGSNHESFWILDEIKKEVGFIRLFDLEDIDDGYPLFDLRISNKNRGQGLGKQAVHWLTKYLFEKWPQLERIAGTTRVDNSPMRKLFRAVGYVKEGHYRNDWATANGELYDTVKYSILRKDWEAGTKTPVNWDDDY
ncbi:MAG: GNAT family N-acetyltransferase [Bacteriovorax sp.]|nr:GNAT family N-acetyltransferase [Bacteriovorax sp.]